MYKPKQVKQTRKVDTIEQGFSKLRSDMERDRGSQAKMGQHVGQNQQQQQFNIPNIWQPKQQAPAPPPATRQTTLEEFGMKAEVDEPYWSAEQWEEWAYELMTTYTDQSMLPKEMMPEWFVQAVEEGE